MIDMSIFDDSDLPTAGQKASAATLIFSAKAASRHKPEAGRDFLMQYAGLDEQQAWAVLDGDASLMGDTLSGFWFLEA